MPAFTAKGAKALVDVVTAGEGPLPFVLLDADAGGRQFAFGLKQDVYRDAQERVLAVSDFRKIVDGEVEDLLPASLLAPLVDRFLRKPAGVSNDFVDVVNEQVAFVPQVVQYAAKYDIALDAHWQDDFARMVQRSVINAKSDVLRDVPEFVALWTRVFDAIHHTQASEPATATPVKQTQSITKRRRGRKGRSS
jgi:hypothetical protein